MIKFNKYQHKPFNFDKESTYQTRLICSISEMYKYGDDDLINQLISDLKDTIDNGAKHTEEIEFKYFSDDRVVLAIDNELGEITLFYDIGPEDEFSMVGFKDQDSLIKSCTK